MQTLNPFLQPILKELDLFFDHFPHTNEHQIIKHLQDKKIEPFDQFNLSLSKDLFSAHFLCMHALYHLKNQYAVQQTFVIIIQSVRVQRFSLSLLHSSKTNEEIKQFIEVSDPLASYYLDPKHYFETREDEINDMLKSFWTKYLAQDKKQEALSILELPVNADMEMIKKQYRRLAQKHHPDKGGCAEKFNEIREAKTILDNSFH